MAGPNPFNPAGSAQCTVKNGSAAGVQFPANITVSELRGKVGRVQSIDPAAHAYRNGIALGEHDMVNPGDVITFIRKTGEKGTR